MPDHTELNRWLEAERSGQDDAADEAFLSVFATMPRIQPNSAFADRTMTAVLRWRARRRRLIAFAWAAAVFIVLAGGAAAVLLGPTFAPSVVKPLALGISRATPWLIAYLTEAMNLWWALAGLATAIGNALATPPTATAIVGAELLGIFAFFALQRLVAAERTGEMEI